LLRHTAAPTTGFRAPFYPILPILFIVMTAALLINTMVTMPIDTAIGFAIIALGLPVYEFFRRRRDPGIKVLDALTAK
jgi:APA family basic amino acid/polyamine antiporter